MEVIRGNHNLRSRHRGCVATIGNFDGVHLGHQAVFRNLMERGRELGLPSVVITFEPQPQEYFAPQQAPARLTRLREKMMAIEESGIDRVLLLEFHKRLAAMEAHDFVEQILVQGLGMRFLYVGDDFRFGRGRHGDFQMLCELGRKHGFAVETMHTFRLSEDRVSSTRVRELLTQGELEAAAHLLGRPYRICGRVAHGDKRGRTIGFPTANVDLHRRVSPVRGVFAVRVHGLEDGPLPGVSNIGTRPTVTGDPRYLLEVHLFDFAREIYGEHVEVEFVHKLRYEKRFDSFEELRRQILQDAWQGRQVLEIT